LEIEKYEKEQRDLKMTDEEKANRMEKKEEMR